MQRFDAIRPFYDTEINDGIKSSYNHPMMKALMNFCFPDVAENVWQEQLLRTYSSRDFQCNFIYHGVMRVINHTSDGLTTSGFEKLEKNTSYLFISNHRDIILDTSLLSASLFEHGLVMTASAIGNNLVNKDFLLTLSKLNRNFLVQRGLSPRELLQSSQILSELIEQFLYRENRSVWIAQREGRTKDGNDATNPGVLKMLAMARGSESIIDYFKKVKIVPVSISYHYDPTDAFKMPQFMAEANNEIYTKQKNEDFKTMISGVVGQKKGIHIHIGDPLINQLDTIAEAHESSNKQIQAIAQLIDDSILQSYKLWPTNYLAYDIVNKTDLFSSLYTENEKSVFLRRMEMKIGTNNDVMTEGFIAMYANPVVNRLKYVSANSLINPSDTSENL